MLLAALVLVMPVGQAAAEYTSCERPNFVWAGIDQVITLLPLH